VATIETLIAGLHSLDAVIRLEAAAGLGQYGALHEDVSRLPDAVPSLVDMLQGDPVHDLRLAAAYSLGAVGDARAVPELIESLRTSDDDPGMQLVIAKALGKIGDPRAVQALAEVMQGGLSRCLSVAASKALERIGTPPALAAIEKRKRLNDAG
jgi:HEAT repeat protein